MIRSHPKPGPKKKVRRWKTPRCTFGKGRCKRPQVMDGMCKSHGKQEAWRLLSLEVRSLGYCQLKGMDTVRCGGVLQAAHIFPKGAYPRIKLDRQNILCICAGHHRYYTERWPGWREVVIRLLGQTTFDEIWSRSGA